MLLGSLNVPLMEERQVLHKGEAYKQYQREITQAFFPWPPPSSLANSEAVRTISTPSMSKPESINYTRPNGWRGPNLERYKLE